MNRLDSFEQFLAAGNVQFSFWNYSLNLFLTALLAYLLALMYNRFGNSLSNRKSFGKNFVLLAVTTMIIITIVKSSLALSLGLVGALSIVRFRAAIKEPEELSYLFLNIAIGLGFGADQKLATLTGFGFICIFLVSKGIFYKKADYDNENLILTLSLPDPEKDHIEKITQIIKKHTSRAILKRFDETKQAMEITYLIETDSFEKINDMKIELQNSIEYITIGLIDNSVTT